MKTNKTLAVLVVIIGVIATVLGVSYPQPQIISVDEIVKQVKETVSFGNSPDNFNPVNFQGGIGGTRAGFVSTTTIACAIQNPTNATTTFVSVGFRSRVSTTTTTVLGVSTSTNAARFSTSTALMSKTIAANAVASASYVPTSNNNILGPGEWVLVGYGAGTTLPAVAQQQNGECSVLFNSI